MARLAAQWQADLADMQGIARQNGKMRYLLIVIEVFFKFALSLPVHSKNADAIIAAYDQVLKVAQPRHPWRLQADKGKKFLNSDFQGLMQHNGMQHFANESERKVTVVKRFNQIIKTRIWTSFSDRGSVRWVDVIQNIVKAYNHSHHRSIGMAPVNVQKKEEDSLWVRL